MSRYLPAPRRHPGRPYLMLPTVSGEALMSGRLPAALTGAILDSTQRLIEHT